MNTKNLRKGWQVKWTQPEGISRGIVVNDNADGTLCVEVTKSTFIPKGDLIDVPIDELKQDRTYVWLSCDGESRVSGYIRNGDRAMPLTYKFKNKDIPEMLMAALKDAVESF